MRTYFRPLIIIRRLIVFWADQQVSTRTLIHCRLYHLLYAITYRIMLYYLCYNIHVVVVIHSPRSRDVYTILSYDIAGTYYIFYNIHSTYIDLAHRIIYLWIRTDLRAFCSDFFSFTYNIIILHIYTYIHIVYLAHIS